MVRFLKSWWSDESGATSIEYAMIASVVSILIVGIVLTIGTLLSDLIGATSGGLA